MSSLDPKPVKPKRILNTKLLPIAALLLVVLALLFLAAPLIRLAGGTQRAGNFVTPGNGQSGSSVQGSGPQVLIGGAGSQAQTRRFTVGTGGRGGIILYFVMLLVSLAAAVGMLFTRRWGQVLGIIIAVLYGLLGLVSLLPLLLIRIVGAPNPVSLVLGIVHVLLSVSVIVLASIPGKPGLPLTPAPASSSA
ncbi:MAG: hypothetical protein ABSA23_06010 [Anaerolineales bacterium]|jgi:hypothetical protein